jgi:hypothetical protein
MPAVTRESRKLLWRELKLWLSCLFLIIAGVSLAMYAGEKWRPPADALIIAGVLALTVDRYVKLRLREEIAHDVFFAALGIDLHPWLKEEVLAVGDYKLVRHEMQLTYKISRSDDDGYISCETETYFEIENLTNRTQPFTNALWLSDPPLGARRPPFPISYVKAKVPKSKGYEHDAEHIKLTSRDRGILWEGLVTIPAHEKAEFWSTTHQTLPIDYEEPFVVSQPTIGITVRVECPSDMDADVFFFHRLGEKAEKLPHRTWKLNAAVFPYTVFRTVWARSVAAEAPLDMRPRLRLKATGQSINVQPNPAKALEISSEHIAE